MTNIQINLICDDDEAEQLHNDPNTIYGIRDFYAKKDDEGRCYMVDRPDHDHRLLILGGWDEPDIVWTTPEDANTYQRRLLKRIDELEYAIGDMGGDIARERNTASELNDIVGRLREMYAHLENEAADRVRELLDTIEQAEAKEGRFTAGRQKGASVNKSRAAERDAALSGMWHEAKKHAVDGDKEPAYQMLKKMLDAWVEADPTNRRGLSISTLRKQF